MGANYQRKERQSLAVLNLQLAQGKIGTIEPFHDHVLYALVLCDDAEWGHEGDDLVGKENELVEEQE